ncbi:MAG: hypothetical protein KH282_01880 [Clostridiales bacterium]|nr:hypothetical protein [Clostridiales bacterium]
MIIHSLNDFCNKFFDETGAPIKPIILNIENNYTINITSFIGRGSYNVVFFAEYEKNSIIKACILKYFLPIEYIEKGSDKHGNQHFDFCYEINMEEQTGKIILQNIRLSVPAQYSYYVKKVKEYRTTNNRIIGLLSSDEINSFIPKPYDEQIYSMNFEEPTPNYDLTSCFMIFAYDSQISLTKYLMNCDSITKRLEIVISLINLIGVLYYQKNMLMLDIKFDNFIFKDHEKVRNRMLKIIDWDSIVELDSEKRIPIDTTIHSSDGFRPYEVEKHEIKNIGVKSTIFMLGACLYQALFMPSILKGELLSLPVRPGTDIVSIEYDKRISQAFEKLELSQGFQNKFFDIMRKSYTQEIDDRYTADEYFTEIEKMSDDVQVLLEIYDNKGVHPEVMLNNAIKDISNKDKFSEDQFDPGLFTEIEVIE